MSGAPAAGGGAFAAAAPVTRRAALRRAAEFLDRAGVADGGRDARFLLLGILGLEARDLALDGERPLDAGEAARLSEALARRASGEPVARVLGAWEFWGLNFRLAPETLVPRPDTESLVEAALAAAADRAAPRILDLGTGSGCILVALLHARPDAWGLGLDRSEGALRAARDNADANGVGSRAAFAAGDWCAPLCGAFDLVVSNPPYVASGVIPGLDREVREHDPAAALDGGPDGLDAYRAILAAAPRLLAPGAPLVCEIGHDQADAVRALGLTCGLLGGGLVRDLAGRDRVLTFRAHGAAAPPDRAR